MNNKKENPEHIGSVLERVLKEIAKNQTQLDPEYNEIVNGNFDELLESEEKNEI